MFPAYAGLIFLEGEHAPAARLRHATLHACVPYRFQHPFVPSSRRLIVGRSSPSCVLAAREALPSRCRHVGDSCLAYVSLLCVSLDWLHGRPSASYDFAVWTQRDQTFPRASHQNIAVSTSYLVVPLPLLPHRTWRLERHGCASCIPLSCLHYRRYLSS